MGTDAANVRAAAALLDNLAAAGVREVCISPGSRSAPLALIAGSHPGLQHYVITDERDAAFFALGIAKRAGRPAAVLCTSGTAAANFAPAVAEASLGRVPLIVMTADRPTELRDAGAAQTIRQPGLFASHVCWSVDAAVPEESWPLERYFGTLACRAVAAARRCRAPVHINVPFREPLWSDAALERVPRGKISGPRVDYSHAATGIDDATVRRLASRLLACERGLLVCGPGTADENDLDAFVDLARALGWPLLLDPLSGMRFGALHAADGASVVVDAYDVLLRSETFAAAHRPDLVLRFGAPLTSKVLVRFLADQSAASQIAAWPGGMWADPDFVVSDVIECDPMPLVTAIGADLLGSGAPKASTSAARARRSQPKDEARSWLESWADGQTAVRASLSRSVLGAGQAFEGAIASTIVDSLPEGSTLFVGNSLPVRAVDTFAAATDRRIRVLANRGANGIDGVTATALGAASVSHAPSVLFTGDLSFLHDVGALQIAHRHRLSLTIVIANNDGGGIFSFLQRPAKAGLFEELFATPHGIELGRAVEMCGGRHRAVSVFSDLASTLASALRDGGLQVVEIATDRERTVRLHQECVDLALADADRALGKPR